MRNWETQWNRVLRYEERLYELTRQVPFNRPAIYFCDDALAFFVECHSLKDWLIEDRDVLPGKGWQAKERQINDFVKSDFLLQLCADIANGKKHMVLGKRERAGKRKGKRKKRHTFVKELKAGKLPGLSISIEVILRDEEEGDVSYSCFPSKAAADANQEKRERLDDALRTGSSKVFREVCENILSTEHEDDQGTWEDAAATADRIRADLLDNEFPQEDLFLNIFVDFVLDDKPLRFDRDDPRSCDFDEGAASFASGCTLRWTKFFDDHIPSWNS